MITNIYISNIFSELKIIVEIKKYGNEISIKNIETNKTKETSNLVGGYYMQKNYWWITKLLSIENKNWNINHELGNFKINNFIILYLIL